MRGLAAAVAFTAALGTIVAHAQPHYTSDDVHAAIRQTAAERGVSEGFLDCIVRRESTYRPYAIGDLGEEGAVQLHPRGEGIRFRASGYTDPFNPYQALDYLAVAILEGRGPQWAGWWRCIA